jgi:cation diffusion facilitator CzcD-associated flavoprotein CzcO
MSERDVDVAIIGAGLSGIGMAVHLQKDCPDRSYTILERRENLGGTWDLFRYPGIRSDSDMHTLGFVFEPWREQKAIADGPNILGYLNRIADERGVRKHIQFDSKVVAARWSSDTARWTIEIEHSDGSSAVVTARYVYMGAGYYDYDAGYDPEFAGRESFKGQIVHPQFWPENLDYKGKRIVVIGSGATAVTLLPNLARGGAEHVTMLQRTPTYYAIRPAEDGLANFMRKVMPDTWAYGITRFKNVRMQKFFFNRARTRPEKVSEFLLGKVREELGDSMNEADFTPPYGPWDQRLCLVPDGDMFKEIKAGRAEVVTDHIERFTENGIQLKSGKHLDADIIITATGLKLAVAGKVAFSVDGQPIDWHQHFYYKGCMFSNLPNLSIVFGYLNASWTLKADIVSTYTCRVLNHMKQTGNDIAVPVLSDADARAADVVFDFSSGYVQRALNYLPRNGTTEPWRLNQDYLHDKQILLHAPVEDGVLQLSKAGRAPIQQNTPVAPAVPEAIAAE